MQGMQGLERLCAGNHFFAVTRITMKETMATTMTAPMSDGKMAMPPSCGPQLPKSAWPSAEPARPAMMLAIQPIDPLRFGAGDRKITRLNSSHDGRYRMRS